jgi:hypothetical protein
VQSGGGSSGLPANFFYELPRIQQVTLGSTSRVDNVIKTIYIRQSATQFAMAEWGGYGPNTGYRIWSQPWQVSASGVITLGTQNNTVLSTSNYSISACGGLDIGGGRGAFVGMLYNNSGLWTQSAGGVTVNADNTVTLGMAYQGQYSTTTNNGYLWPGTAIGPCGSAGYFAVTGYNASGYVGYNFYSFSSGTTPQYQSNGVQFSSYASYASGTVPAMQAWDDASARESIVWGSTNSAYPEQYRFHSVASNTTGTLIGSAEALFGYPFAGSGAGNTVGLRLGSKCVYFRDSTSAIVTDGAGTLSASRVSVIGHQLNTLSSSGLTFNPIGGGYFFNGGNLYHATVNAGNTLVTVRLIAAFRPGTGLLGLSTPFSADEFTGNSQWSTAHNNNVLVVSTRSGVSTYDFTKVKALMVY